jgi:AraC family transcriptional regulator
MYSPDAAPARHGQREPRRPVLSSDVQQRLEAFIRANLSHALTIARLAASVHLSPFHFARSFKNTFGVTPHQYVTRERVMRAHYLLRSGDMPIGGVARAVGYSSHGQFSTVFRRVTGSSPRQYRRRSRQACLHGRGAAPGAPAAVDPGRG